MPPPLIGTDLAARPVSHLIFLLENWRTVSQEEMERLLTWREQKTTISLLHALPSHPMGPWHPHNFWWRGPVNKSPKCLWTLMSLSIQSLVLTPGIGYEKILFASFPYKVVCFGWCWMSPRRKQEPAGIVNQN